MMNRKHSKKLSAVVLTGILMAAMTVSAFGAPSQNKAGGMMGPGGQGMNQMMGSFPGGGMPGMTEGDQSQLPEFSEGEMPELPEFSEGEMPELPEFSEGEQPQLPEFSEGEQPELPEFSEGEMPQLPEFSEGELPKAGGMNDVKLSVSGNSVPMGPGQGGQREQRREQMLNVDSISESIAAITDEDTKTELSELLSAYQEALDAEREALEAGKESLDNEGSVGEDVDMESLKNAVSEAGDALLTALNEAGVEIELPKPAETEEIQERPSNEERAAFVNRQNNIEKSSAALSTDSENDTDSDNSTEDSGQNKTGFISKIKNAVSNFFSRFKKR